MADIISCGAVLFTRESGEIRYVLVRQLRGFWGLPKGRMEEGETELETALREVYEEVGIKPRIIEGFREINEYILPRKGLLKRVVFFLGEYEGQEIIPREGELSGAETVSLDRAMELLRHEGTRQVLGKADRFIINNLL